MQTQRSAQADHALYLRLRRPHLDSELVVEFGLAFEPGRVILTLASPDDFNYVLFVQLAGELTIRLSK